MARGQYDVLLTIGADDSALRAQIAALERQLGLRVNIGAQGGAQVQQQLNAVQQGAERAGRATQRMLDQQRLWAQNFRNTLQNLRVGLEAVPTSSRTAANRVAADMERIRAGTALSRNEFTRLRIAAAEALGALRAQSTSAATAARENARQAAESARQMAEVQRAGRIQATAMEENVSRAQRLGRLQTQALAENARRDAAARQTQIQGLLEFNRQLDRLSAREFTLRGLPQRPEVQQAQQAIQGLRSQIVATGQAVDRVQWVKFTNELNQTIRTVRASITPFDQLVATTMRAFRVGAQFTLVYGALRLALASVAEATELDRQMTRIAASMEQGADRAAILRQNYELVRVGMTSLGQSAKQSGDLVFELSKTLDNNTTLMRAALIPALTLTGLSETQQAETIRVLVGAYNIFGATLQGVTTDVERFTRISDVLLASSFQSVASVQDFAQALQYVGPAAARAGVQFEEVVTIIGLLQDGLVRASQSGTGLFRLLEDLAQRGPQIAELLNIPFDLAVQPDQITFLRQVVRAVIAEVEKAGGVTTRFANRLKDVFPDIRGERSLLTLLQVFAQYDERLAKARTSTGQTEQSFRELTMAVGAAAASLGNEFLIQLDRVLSKMGGDTPGKFEALARSLNNFRSNVEWIGSFSVLLASLPETARREFAARIGFDLRQLEKDMSELNELYKQFSAGRLPGFPRTGSLPLPEEGVPLAGPGPVTRSAREIIDRDIKALQQRELARISADVRREAIIADRELPLAERITAAMDDLRTAEATLLRERRRFSSLSTAVRDEDRDRIKSALEAAEKEVQRRRTQVRELQSDQAQGLSRAFEDDLRRSAEMLRMSGQGEAAFLRESAAQLAADFQAIGEDRVSSTEEINGRIEASLAAHLKRVEVFRREFDDAQIQGLTELLQTIRSQTEQESEAVARTIRETFHSLSSAAAGDPGGIDLRASLARIAERDLGLDTAQENLDKITATLGLFGERATDAEIRASQLFKGLMQAAQTTPGLEFLVAVLNKIPGRIAKLTEEARVAQLTKQLEDTERQTRAAMVAFGRFGAEAVRQSQAILVFNTRYELLNDMQREFIERVTSATLATQRWHAALSLASGGLSDVAQEIIETNEAVDENLRNIEKAIDEVTRFNDRSDRIIDAELLFTQQRARLNSNAVQFLVAGFERTLRAGSNLWESLDRLAADTARSMSQAFSDFFFNVLTGNFESLKDAFKSFLNSMARSLADFLASAVVREFLGIFGTSALGAAGGAGGSAAGGAAGTVLAGAGASALTLLGAAGILSGNRQAMQAGAFASLLGGGLGLYNAYLGPTMTAANGARFIQPGMGNLASAGGLLAGANVVGGLLTLLGTSQNNPRVTSAGQLVSGGATAATAATGIAASVAAGTAGQAALTASLSNPYLAAAILAAVSIFNAFQTSANWDRLTPAQRTGATIGGIAANPIAGGLVLSGLVPERFAPFLDPIGSLFGGLIGGLIGGGLPESAKENRRLSRELDRLLAGLQEVKSPRDILNLLTSGPQQPSVAGKVVTPTVGGQRLTTLDQVLAAIQNPALAGVFIDPTNPYGNRQGREAVVKAGTQAVQDFFKAFGEQFQQVEQELEKILREMFVASVRPAAASTREILAFEAGRLRDAIAAITQGMEQAIDAARVGLLTLTDPQKLLEQTAQIRSLIEDRYQTEIQLVQAFAAELDKLGEAWRDINRSVEDQLFQLRLSSFGPTNPLEAFTLARGRFEEALTGFRSERTPAAAAEVQQLVDPFLETASQLFARPSIEFQTIFHQAVQALEEVQAEAASQEQLLIDTMEVLLGEGNTIASLIERNTALTAEAMAGLHDDVLHAFAALGFGPSHPVSAETLELLQRGVDGLLLTADQLPQVVDPMTDLTGAIRELTATIRGGSALTGGQPLPFDDTGMGGGFQHGTWHVPETRPYLLHRGETVFPPDVATAWRAGRMGGSTTINVTFTGPINVSGDNPRQAAREFVATVIEEVRDGKLGRVIVDRVKRA